MSRRPQVEENDATGELAGLYADWKATCRASFVPTAYRILGAYPAYFVPAWRALRENLGTVYAERAAQRLHRLCVSHVEASPPPVLPLVPLEPEVRRQVAAVLRTFAYVNPKSLLILTALDEAWRGRAIEGSAEADRRPLPVGVPEGMGILPMLDQDAVDGRVREVFERAARLMGGAAVPSVYRTLARWPDYLVAASQAVMEPRRVDRLRGGGPPLVAEARRSCHGFPLPFALERATVARALPAQSLAAIESTLITFQRGIAETMLHAAAMLRDLEGPDALDDDYFPVPVLATGAAVHAR